MITISWLGESTMASWLSMSSTPALWVLRASRTAAPWPVIGELFCYVLCVVRTLAATQILQVE